MLDVAVATEDLVTPTLLVEADDEDTGAFPN